MPYPYTVHRRDAEALSARGYGRVSDIPFLLDPRPGWHRLANAFLIDRGLGKWDWKHRGARETLAPGPNSMWTYAHWLSNFLEWAERRGIDLLTCTYREHVLGRYQVELSKGLWSRDNRGLSPSTVNSYVQLACEFLLWMYDKGHRGLFEVPTAKVRIYTGSVASSHGHRAKEVDARQGKVRPNKRRLRMPTDEAVWAWKHKVFAKYASGRGHISTMGLMCETVLATALRRAEVVGMRADTLDDDPLTWHIPNPTLPYEAQVVKVDIRYGAKGRTYGFDHGDKVGPQEEIAIPRPLADRLHTYKNTTRVEALKSLDKRLKAQRHSPKERQQCLKATVHLFLNEETGERVNSKQFYNAWTSVDLPMKGWSPHLGRDWWACQVLTREMRKREAVAGLLRLGKDAPAEMIKAMAEDIIAIHVQPQLRHKHSGTSMIYVFWVVAAVQEGLAIQYESDLEVAQTVSGDGA